MWVESYECIPDFVALKHEMKQRIKSKSLYEKIKLENIIV